MSNNSQSNTILGYYGLTVYNFSDKSWVEQTTNIYCLSIGCDGTKVLCQNDNTIISLNIENNYTIISQNGLPSSYGNFISIAVGNSNYIWGITNTGNIYNYINGYWKTITLSGIVSSQLTSIYIGFDGSIWVIGSDGKVYNYIFNNVINSQISPIWKQINSLILSSMAILISNYFWGITTTNIINLYSNYNNVTSNIGSIISVLPPISTPTSLYISCCYDGNIYCLCNNLLFKRSGISSSNPGGSNWIQISSNVITQLTQIISGPSYTYAKTQNFPYFPNILGYSPINYSYYQLNDIKDWLYQEIVNSVSIGNSFNNIITCNGPKIYLVTNFNYSITLSNTDLSSNFQTFISTAIINLNNLNIIYGISNDNIIYYYNYTTNIGEGNWISISSPINTIIITIDLGFDGSIWLLDNNNNIYSSPYSSPITQTPTWTLISSYKATNISTISSAKFWGSNNNIVSYYYWNNSIFTQTIVNSPITNLYVSYSNDQSIWCVCNGILFQTINNNNWIKQTQVGNNPLITQITSGNITNPPLTNVYGYSPGNYFKYQPETKDWNLLGNADCISSSSLNIVVCTGNIITIYDNFNNILYLNISGLPSDFTGFIFISATDLNNICGIITTNTQIVYKYSFTDNISNGTWTSIGGPIPSTSPLTNTLSNLSVGIDGSVWIINAINNNKVITYSVYNYSSTEIKWNLINIIATQISVYNINTIVGIYNGQITIYNNIQTSILANNITLPILDTYVGVSYDNTIWCLSAGLIFERNGITNSLPYGNSWILMNHIINTFPITEITVAPSYSFNNNSQYILPYEPIIVGYNTSSSTYSMFSQKIWNTIGDANCISIGSDQNIIVCHNLIINFINKFGISTRLSNKGLPDTFQQFISISIGDINNIYGIININNAIYNYKFIGNINNGSWYSIPQPSVLLNSIYTGFDSSVWGIDISNNIHYYNNQIWTSTNYTASNISIATYGYFWGVLNNNNNTYTISVYTNNGSGIIQTVWNTITSTTPVYISVCYDGTIWYIANGFLYVSNNISFINPQGSLTWTQVTTTADTSITRITIGPGRYYIGNTNPYYIWPYYILTATQLGNTTYFPLLPTNLIHPVIIPSNQIIFGIGISGSSYIYNNYLAQWVFKGYNSSNKYSITVGSPPISYNSGINTVAYCIGTTFYLGSITTNSQLFSSIIWTSFNSPSVSLVFLSMLNNNNIWAIGIDNNIYQFTGTNWTNIPFPTQSSNGISQNVSIGFDNTVMAIDTSNNVYTYSNLIWNQLPDIYLTQISIGSNIYYWGVDPNFNIYCFYNNIPIIVVPPQTNAPIISVYISICYDGTIWSLVNSNLYKRGGITSSNPEGINWIIMTPDIIDNIISLSVGANLNTIVQTGTYIFPLESPSQPTVFPSDTILWLNTANTQFNYSLNSINQDYSASEYYNNTSNDIDMNIPIDTLILGYSNFNYYIWSITNQSWSLGGPADCLSIGCDKNTIVCNNNQILLIDIYNISTNLSNIGLPDYINFISISNADINNIWGIINTDTSHIYKYMNDWIQSAEAPTGVILSTVSVGYDTSIWTTTNNSLIYNYTIDTWVSTPYYASQISVASINYFWGIYNNTISLYLTQKGSTQIINVSNPISTIISLYISVCYDGTVWCICNGIIFIRIGISTSNPAGIGWTKIVQIINNPLITKLITGPGSLYLSKDATVFFTWPFYGPSSGQSNCIGFGCDNTVIYCDNINSYTITTSDWEIFSALPNNIIFSQISVADKNNIWALSNIGTIYQYLNYSWTLISGP